MDLERASLPRVEKISFKGEPAWIKRPEPERKDSLVLLHKALEYVLPQVLHRTGASGGIEAIKDEAVRLKIFEAASLPVPKILALTDDALILSSTGNQLRKTLRDNQNKPEHVALLRLAMEGLKSIHEAGLCHGRPFLKDMTVDANGKLYFLDLEEDPRAKMSLQDAQARDVWMLLASCTEFCSDPLHELAALLKYYTSNSSTDIVSNLRALGKGLRPFRFIISALHIKNLSQDITGAYWSAKILERF